MECFTIDAPLLPSQVAFVQFYETVSDAHNSESESSLGLPFILYYTTYFFTISTCVSFDFSLALPSSASSSFIIIIIMEYGQSFSTGAEFMHSLAVITFVLQ